MIIYNHLNQLKKINLKKCYSKFTKIKYRMVLVFIYKLNGLKKMNQFIRFLSEG